MGQEVTQIDYLPSDFERFKKALRAETAVLKRWFEERHFTFKSHACGLELEAWLVDKHFTPCPNNEAFLAAIDHPLAGPELSRCNFELNSTPVAIDAGKPSLSTMHDELDEVWNICAEYAEQMGLHAVAVGVIPTLKDKMLSLETMSTARRYRALNEQLFATRDNRPLPFHIAEGEELHLENSDIMLEAAATSLQVHFQVTQEEAARAYNASLIATAPLVGASANSPYLYGKQLWEETRIAVFERAVPGGDLRDSEGNPVFRASLGSGFVRHSLLELFLENCDGYQPILPIDMGDNPEEIHHLRLHNGTIWRWNRPIIGTHPETGENSLRIEHRAMASGPTVVDVMANAAFYLGLAYGLMGLEDAPENNISFHAVRDNFYNAAKLGLRADVQWIDGKTYRLQTLCLEKLVPLAREGLKRLGISEKEQRRYMDDVIEPRIATGQNGATWQKAYISKYGKDFEAMTKQYYLNQQSGKPVHTWEI